MKTGKKLHYGLLLAGSLLAAPATGFAAEQPESVEMRITRLEQELAELKALMKLKSETAPANAQAPVTPAPSLAAPAPKQEPLSVSLGAGVKAQLYGFTRLDAIWESGQIYPGNIALWAQPQGMGRNDGEWNLTAGASRLGVNLGGPDTEKLKISGNIEIDFTGGGTENNQNPRMRHAYLKAFWPASDFSIVAGQTWDLVAAQIPFTDDPAIMWGAGNIGGRHPQLRLTKGFKTGEKGRIEVAVAASRTIGEKNTIPTTTVVTDPGRDADMPTIQGRIALSGPVLVESKPATIALSGHYGQEQWDTDTGNTHKTLDTWSCNLELSLPMSPQLTLAGEYFTGSNLDEFWGGIGQGVNTGKVSGKITNIWNIRSHGGWAALKYFASPSTTFSIGAGIDDPDDNDLAGYPVSPGIARTMNRTIFANVINQVTPNFILGFQLGEWITDYMGAPRSEAVRAQSSVTYKF
ncbi:MAG: hypothetical protein HGA62_01560 [Chlorobiaceae bacterium]|nr:hypothetical protein [Chlorobiaceae bacterium]NTV61061.1 hypothetical protein [Chlorobiaceae bacterium]